MVSKMFFPVVALSVIATGLGIRYVSRSATAHTPEHAAVPSTDLAELAEVRGEVRLLRNEVRETSLRAQRGEIVVEQRGTEPASSASAGEPTRAQVETAQREAEQRREAYMDEVGFSFRNEPVDRGWSSRVSAEIEGVLRSDDVNLNAQSVECHSQSCRVAFVKDSNGNLQKGLPPFLNKVATPLPNTLAHQEVDTRGVETTVVYLFRGAPPPSVDDPG